MNIKKVRDILKRDREVSLHDLSLETGESMEDIKYILEDWEDRNRVTTVTASSCSSGGCNGCSVVSPCGPPAEKIYRWV